MAMRKNTFILWATLALALLTLEVILLSSFTAIPETSLCKHPVEIQEHQITDDRSVIDFTGFNNETGTPNGCYIVPNIVHFIRFTGQPVSYVHMICYLAAFKHQRPDKIYFHFDNETTFSGKYWDILANTPGFMDVVEFMYAEMPTEIFGQKFNNSWLIHHASTVTRIRILIEHGGIFLDNDSYMVRSLDDFRRYETTLNWDIWEGQFLGCQVLIAHKDARFLKLWLDLYRGAYSSDEWVYNSCERPTVEILHKTPELIHRVKYLFGAYNGLAFEIYTKYWPLWRNMYTVQLLHKHLYVLGSFEKKLPSEFDEENIKLYGNTFREMAFDVYNPDNLTFTYKEGELFNT